MCERERERQNLSCYLKVVMKTLFGVNSNTFFNITNIEMIETVDNNVFFMIINF